MKMFFKFGLVIFLTLLFKIIGLLITNVTLILCLLIGAISFCWVIMIVISQRKINLIMDSSPAFLNFINLTMSTGKSMSSAFETAITYQNPAFKSYYQRMYHRIFFLKNQNSGFFFKSQQDFYKKIFIIADSSAYQKDKIIKLKHQIQEELEIQRKEKALKAPFRVQILIFCLIYMILLIWHFNFRPSYPSLEYLSFIFFVMGLFSSYFITKVKTVV